MSKLLTTLLAATFAAVTLSPVAFAQDQKKDQTKAQVHKGTPEQGTVQKKEGKKKSEGKKGEQKKKGEGKKKAVEK